MEMSWVVGVMILRHSLVRMPGCLCGVHALAKDIDSTSVFYFVKIYQDYFIKRPSPVPVYAFSGVTFRSGKDFESHHGA